MTNDKIRPQCVFLGGRPWILNRSRNKLILSVDNGSIITVDFPSLKMVPDPELAKLLASTTGKCQVTDDLRTAICEGDSDEEVICRSVAGAEQRVRLLPGAFLADAERINDELFLIEKDPAKGITQVANVSHTFVRHFQSMKQFVWDFTGGKLFFIDSPPSHGQFDNLVVTEWNYVTDQARTFKLVQPVL